MYKTKNLGLNITEMPKDKLVKFNFKDDLGDNFEAIDKKTITHRNITNCLLEVPQHIKYELNDGTLTIKAGSIVSIPYGTEDLTTTYPVGETFLNDNFTVYDTYYSNSKFFVSVKMVEDLSGISQFSVAGNTFVYLALNEGALFIEHPSYNMGSGSASVEDGSYYNTESNSVVRRAGGEDSFNSTFPLMEVTVAQDNKVTSINQVFNGLGYIGSTVFALPGVKGLIPNGVNEDGTLNTETLTLETVVLGTALEANTFNLRISSNGIGMRDFYIQDTAPTVDGYAAWFNPEKNMMFKNSGAGTEWEQEKSFIGGVCVCLNTTNIDTFTAKKPFQAVDYNEYTSKIAELEAKITALQEALQG